MKKIIFLIIGYFVIAMLTSVLLDWDFIEYNRVRYVLVVIFILLELTIGFFDVKDEIKNLK